MSKKKKQLMTLHDATNPEQEIEIDPDDFSAAIPDISGCSVRLKDSDTLLHVSESSIEVKKAYLNASD